MEHCLLLSPMLMIISVRIILCSRMWVHKGLESEFSGRNKRAGKIFHPRSTQLQNYARYPSTCSQIQGFALLKVCWLTCLPCNLFNYSINTGDAPTHPPSSSILKSPKGCQIWIGECWINLGEEEVESMCIHFKCQTSYAYEALRPCWIWSKGL